MTSGRAAGSRQRLPASGSRSRFGATLGAPVRLIAGVAAPPLRGLTGFAAAHRPGPRALVALGLVLALMLGAWLWLRDSSLVAVRKVAVVGVSGADAGPIRSALVRAARNMTTLDVSSGQLHTAVAPYPDVEAVHVSTQFPHGMRIDVTEQIPVALVSVDGRSTAVAADGTLLRRHVASGSLPSIPLRVAPGGDRLTEGGTAQELTLLAAAPYQLLAKVASVTRTSAHGLVAQLRSGPALYFGSPTRLADKWDAAVAVLADGGSAGANYIDLTDPARPAAGGGALAAQSAASANPTTTTTPSGI